MIRLNPSVPLTRPHVPPPPPSPPAAVKPSKTCFGHVDVFVKTPDGKTTELSGAEAKAVRAATEGPYRQVVVLTKSEAHKPNDAWDQARVKHEGIKGAAMIMDDPDTGAKAVAVLDLYFTRKYLIDGPAAEKIIQAIEAQGTWYNAVVTVKGDLKDSHIQPDSISMSNDPAEMLHYDPYGFRLANLYR